MNKSRSADQQIAFAPKQADAGVPVEEVCRKVGISQETQEEEVCRFGRDWLSERRVCRVNGVNKNSPKFTSLLT